MKPFCHVMLLVTAFLLISGCTALDSSEWRDRLSEVEPVTFTEDTEAFTEIDDGMGNPYWLFRTNDSRYCLPEGDTLWRITDSNMSASVSAMVYRNSGVASSGYGIVFAARKRAGQTYLLCVMINTLQQYSICKYSAGEYSEIQGWTHSSFLKGGYGVANRISVEYAAASKIFTLTLNGGTVMTFQDSGTPRLSTGASGYAVTVSPYEDFPEKTVEVVFCH